MGVLQVFFKPPAAGRVKTRLIPHLGETAATEIHKRLVQKVVATAITFARERECVKGRSSIVVELHIANPSLDAEGLAWVREQWPELTLVPQQGQTLGERMHSSLAKGLENHSAAVIVGGDAYSLCPEYLHQAFDQLDAEGTDVVMGPADDGGYILIGAARLHKDMFLDIPWGSEQVLEMQRERLQACHLTSFELEARWDIDTVEAIRDKAPELLAR